MTHPPGKTSVDSVDRLPILVRRQVEAQIISPIMNALSQRYPSDEVIRILKQTIVGLAREHGRRLARQRGSNTLEDFVGILDLWTHGQALEMDVIEQGLTRLSFNVTRCRYAEYYRERGQEELGKILSCGRDFALIEGFNPRIKLTRTQTILDGAPVCDFRYVYADAK